MRTRHSGAIFYTFIALVFAAHAGCSLLKPSGHKAKERREQAAAKNALAPRLVGTVILVNDQAGFALIDCGGNPQPVVGTTIKTAGADGSSAELRVTAIRKRPFVVADILSGLPEKGAQVLQ